jgi:hypothetical protein
MQKIALYTAATVFIVLAAVQAIFYVFDTHILVGSTLFRPLNVLMAAVLFTLMAVWMLIASLETRSDK